MGQKCEGNCDLWVLNETIKRIYPENSKKIWVPFGSYLLNSTANPAQYEWKWAGLAALFSRYITPKRHPRFFSNFQDIFF